ncbi:MAG: TIM barrel protein [Candidatus Aenigmatarchaeota archaeon]|nr:TIM barrel protein [Candidatus Aenigmarchaeota archaeon]
MTKIFLGPAGNCATSKDKTTIGSLKYLSQLGLNCQEIEFVRSIYLNEKSAKEIAKVAKELNIRLSIHAPYFINLSSDKKQIIENSKRMILSCAKIGEIIDADAIAIHSGYYGKNTKEKTFEMIKDAYVDILDKMKQMGIKNVKLGLETMGKESQFGSIDEIIEMCKQVKGLIPYVDWAHIFVRNNGKIDYGEVFDKLEALKLNHINSHFEGVQFNAKTKKYVDVHTPIDNPPFEPLAREILKREVNITIISESPILELDSLKMKNIFEDLGYKF